MKEPEKAEKDEKEQKGTLYVAVVTAFITTFMGSALNLAIPDMGAGFGAGAGLIGWVITAYMLAVAAFSVPLGRIADLTGRRRILTGGIILFGAFSLFSALARSMEMMLVLRALQGFAGAMIFSTNTATLISSFPPDRRGRVLGYSVFSTYLGLSAGPVAGGMLNHLFGWRSVFLAAFFVTAAVAVIAVRRLPAEEPPPKEALRRDRFDLTGNILYILMTVLLIYGFSALATNKWAPLSVLAGAGISGAFFIHERRCPSPVIDVSLFEGNLNYIFSNLATLLNYGATFAIGYLLSIYLQIALGYSSRAAGMILISQPLVMALVSPGMGRISDSVSPYKLASLGMGICALGLLFFVFLPPGAELWIIMTALVISGLGFGIFSTPNTNAAMSCVDRSHYGVASSILTTMRSLGHTSSMAVITVIVNLTMGTAPLSAASPETLTRTIRIAFTVFFCMCAAGIFISMQRGPAAGNRTAA